MQAEEPSSEAEQPSLVEALTGGTVSAQLRLRAELVEQEGLEDAEAFTHRLRIGYTTERWRGLSLHLDFEDIRALGSESYNAAGLNGRPGFAVVADPEDTELNQFYLRHHGHGVLSEATLGRQRLILDDSRFVGNVGWRQNEQTFDAASAKFAFGDDWQGFYAYLWEVNRIFGPDAGRDFDSQSHLAQLSYAGFEPLQLTAFAYLLDFDNAAAASSSTLGLRGVGGVDLNEALRLGWTASWATQAEYADNPTDYEADYLLADASLGAKGGGWTVGVGYELLGSDGGAAAFQTPLATLHKFNGWADVFLTTPAQGLEDAYFYVDGSLPGKLKGKVVFHRFSADEGGGDFGEELNAQLSRKLTRRIAALLKFADFDGEGALADRRKVWLQFEFGF